MPWESPEQFNRRELISAARYLYRHWGERMPIIVLESTSEAVSEMCVMAPVTVALERAEQMEIEHRQGVLDQARGMIGQPSAAHELLGLDILCVGDYVDLFWDDNKAVSTGYDSLWLTYKETIRRKNEIPRVQVATQWTTATVQAAIQLGELVSGVVRVDRHHYSEALVPIGDAGYVLLPTREHRSNAVHRDLVAVR
jgi:hypothetical protein